METLKNKVAAVFAANGEIAREVAKAFARNGAYVFLSGRNPEKIEELAKEIEHEGGHCEAHQVDVTDEKAIDKHLKHIVSKKAKLDVVFNGVGLRAADAGYGTPASELSFNQFMKPIELHVGSQFITSRLAAKYMMKTGIRGTIITLTASLSRIKTPFMAGITAACTAIEGMTRSLAAEYGRAGIKVICLNPTALVDTRTIKETNAANAKTAGIPEEQFAEMLQQGYLTGQSPTTKDIGQLAAFLATETGALLNSHVVDADFGSMNVI
jgi:NAD(P)-dependent dehydrogenase (short-subunit alcohol dehydrogenase family)